VRIHRGRSQERGGERDLVARGEFGDERLLAEQVIRHCVVCPIEDLLAIVARVQPGARIDGLPRVIAAAHHRLGEIHGIGQDRDVGQVIAVPDEELAERGLVALRHAVAASQCTVLHVGGVDHQSGAHEAPGREAAKCVRRPGRWMRPPIHPDDSMALRGLRPEVNSDQSLRVRIALFPDPEIPERPHLIRRDVGLALVVAQSDSRRIV
jgi:hypothetical protein